MNNIIKLVISIGICLSAGWVGSLFTTPYIQSWYSTINKSPLNPPNSVFGPVWTILFILMGISFYLIWKSGRITTAAMVIFAFQLVLNVLWSFLFFKSQSPLLAFIDIIALWLAILATIWQFSKIEKTAAILLVPYLLWVSFASFLNLSVYLLNR